MIFANQFFMNELIMEASTCEGGDIGIIGTPGQLFYSVGLPDGGAAC